MDKIAGRIMKKFESRFFKIWLFTFAIVLVVLVARFVFFDHAPTLEEVLSRNIRSSYDPSLFIATLLAFSFLALSFAKGYEIFKRNRSITEAVLPEERPELENEDKEIIEELLQTKNFFIRENAELKDRLHNLSSKLEEMDLAEQVLKKSNVSLGKECERLKSENEILILKVNSLIGPESPPPKPRSKAGAKKPRKAAARSKSKK